MTITIPISTCCGALPGDVHDCPQQDAAGLAALMPTLVDRARAGDRLAFGQVYDHYRPTVLRYVLRRVGYDQHLAEDLTQDTFLRALSSVERFTWQGRDFGAWLITIARNLVADHFKSARSRLSISVDPDSYVGSIAPDDDRRHDPEQVAEHNEVSTALDGVIVKLSPDQRRVLALRFGEGLTVDETAAVMGKPSGSIKALQYRATQTLARHLAETSLLSERH